MTTTEVSIDIDHLAALARIELTDSEKTCLRREIASIVTYIDKLSELNLEGVEQMAHAAAIENVWRDDIAAPSFPRSAMLANASACCGSDARTSSPGS